MDDVFRLRLYIGKDKATVTLDVYANNSDHVTKIITLAEYEGQGATDNAKAAIDQIATLYGYTVQDPRDKLS